MAGQIIGPNVKGATSQLTFKMRGNTMPFHWHQDNAYGELDPYTAVTCLTALDDAAVENGCLWLIPGSHRQGQADPQAPEEKAALLPINLEADDSRAGADEGGRGDLLPLLDAAQVGRQPLGHPPPQLLYDNIHDFKTTAVHVESEIIRCGIRHDSEEPVPGMKGRRHRPMWVSMKSVSHFDLGIAIELLLKLILIMNNLKFPRTHSLTDLSNLMPPRLQNQLEQVFQECRRSIGGYELIALTNSPSDDAAALPELHNRDISTIHGFLEYFDEHVILSEKRYSWELVSRGQWRHYLGDISVFVKMIDSVMVDIPRLK